MLPPDDKESGDPCPPANDNLKGLAAALSEIEALASKADSDGVPEEGE